MRETPSPSSVATDVVSLANCAIKFYLTQLLRSGTARVVISAVALDIFTRALG
jgi:hypothetical protein